MRFLAALYFIRYHYTHMKYITGVSSALGLPTNAPHCPGPDAIASPALLPIRGKFATQHSTSHLLKQHASI